MDRHCSQPSSAVNFLSIANCSGRSNSVYQAVLASFSKAVCGVPVLKWIILYELNVVQFCENRCLQDFIFYYQCVVSLTVDRVSHSNRTQ